MKLYVEGVDPSVAAAYGEVVSSPGEADLAILRVQAPYEQRGSMFENFFHAGSLDSTPEVLDHIAQVSASVPTVVDVFLDRPAILAPIVEATDAVVATWGVSSAALLDVLSGASPARGKLPFDIPALDGRGRVLAAGRAVRHSRSDLPLRARPRAVSLSACPSASGSGHSRWGAPVGVLPLG